MKGLVFVDNNEVGMRFAESSAFRELSARLLGSIRGNHR